MEDDSEQSVRAYAESRVGLTLNGKYTLEKVLGIGGMASVYRATHRNGNRVAVKFLHTELCASKDIRERFLREGYVANRVEHDGAVRVLDDETALDGSVYLVMELLEGGTLEDRILENGGRLSPFELVTHMSQLLGVLAAAHEKGIVHRDIKPENLFIERKTGTLKVLDFGIARLNDGARQATRTGRVMGTPVYMAPEQARGETKLVDGQTDLWAVGAIMFRALSGSYVYDAETPEMVMVLAATQPARAIRALVPAVDPALARIIDCALARTKTDRWESAHAMSAALRALTLDKRDIVPAAGPLAPTIDATFAATTPLRANALATEAAAPMTVAHAVAASSSATHDGIAGTTPGLTVRGPKGRLAAIGAVGVLAIGGLVATFVMPRLNAAPAGREQSQGLVSPAPLVVASAAPAASPASSSSELPSAQLMARPIPPVTPPRGAGVAVAPRPSPALGGAPPVAPPAPPASTASAASNACNPPYLLTADGTKQWKMECFKK